MAAKNEGAENKPGKPEVMRHPYAQQSKLLSTLETGYPQSSQLAALGMMAVTGLAQLANKLYVIYYNRSSEVIRVYDTTQEPLRRFFKRLPDLPVSGVEHPSDMAGCIKSNCLYVLDTGCVWRVGTDGKLAEKWLNVHSDHMCHARSVSVTPDGRIVILSSVQVYGGAADRRAGGEYLPYESHIDVYSPYKLKLTVFKLPTDCAHPVHAVQTASNSFIVCYANHFNQLGLSRVDELNNERSVLASCVGLEGPWHIILDKDERVLVADREGRRVLLLNRQLNVERVLTWSSVDCRPAKLNYDPITELLAIGFMSGCVEIYSLHN